MAGGILNGKQLKAILPSGASGPVLPATDTVLDTPMTYEAVEELGSTLGSASFILMDEDTDMVRAAAKMTHFFRHESCGKCTPCREGTYWLDRVYERLLAGNGTRHDLRTLERVPPNMQGVTLCALGDFAANPVISTLKHFHEEYERYIKVDEAQHPDMPKAVSTVDRASAGEVPEAVAEGGA